MESQSSTYSNREEGFPKMRGRNAKRKIFKRHRRRKGHFGPRDRNGNREYPKKSTGRGK